MSFQSVLAEHRSKSRSESEKGSRFERMMQGYLKTDPLYANRFSAVWLWSEFPYREQFGGSDLGIDLVCFTHEGDYWAVQCKCYAKDTVMEKGTVDSFLATSSKRFRNEKREEIGFSHLLWISTSDRWGKKAETILENQNPPVSRINLYDLENSAVDWDELNAGIFGQHARLEKKKLLPHQIVAVEKVLAHFANHDRGKLIMACGTGKTFTSLKIAERWCDEKKAKKKCLVLVLVPSIALIGQTLREWTANCNTRIAPICICSDSTASRSGDEYGGKVIDLALPASTDTKNIVKQLHHALYNDPLVDMVVLFSTYQSIEVVAEVQKQMKFNLDLLLRIITVSMQTMDIVDKLPKMTFTEEEKV